MAASELQSHVSPHDLPMAYQLSHVLLCFLVTMHHQFTLALLFMHLKKEFVLASRRLFFQSSYELYANDSEQLVLMISNSGTFNYNSYYI